jgi:hypothetical protein
VRGVLLYLFLATTLLKKVAISHRMTSIFTFGIYFCRPILASCVFPPGANKVLVCMLPLCSWLLFPFVADLDVFFHLYGGGLSSGLFLSQPIPVLPTSRLDGFALPASVLSTKFIADVLLYQYFCYLFYWFTSAVLFPLFFHLRQGRFVLLIHLLPQSHRGR